MLFILLCVGKFVTECVLYQVCVHHTAVGTRFSVHDDACKSDGHVDYRQYSGDYYSLQHMTVFTGYIMYG